MISAVQALPAVEKTRGFRLDIQALRTLAVGSVVLYHLYPGLLPGGFTGVDIFLVISGFLITSHLITKPPQNLGDLMLFWARRIRRLLPASLTVLAATLITAQAIAPESAIPDLARMARAAATYWVNWMLAGDSIDYLRADDTPTAVQHFWSLSVEEQFYLGWPIVLALLVLLARRKDWSIHTVVLSGLSLIVFASFVASIQITESNPGAAYFVTWTRLWELGVGCLLAVYLNRPGRGTRRKPTPLFAWAGLGAIAFALVTFNSSTPFPGYHAAIPVLGTAAIIYAHVDSSARTNVGFPLVWMMERRSVQWTGAASYSIYLWHWPILLLLPFVTNDVGFLDKVGVLAATVALAGLTKTYIEDPARTWRPKAQLAWVYTAAAAGMAIVVVLATWQIRNVEQHVIDARQAAEDAVAAAASPTSCLGASAIGRADCDAPTYDSLIVPPAAARADKSQTHDGVPGGRNCAGQEQNNFELVRCSFGDSEASTTVALIGDSHAQHWLPTLQQLGETDPVNITTMVSSGCNFAGIRQLGPTASWTDGCERWAQNALNTVVEEDPDLVVISNRTFRAVEGFKGLKASRPAYVVGAQNVLATLEKAGIPVLVIRDTPIPQVGSVPKCIDANSEDLTQCGGPRKSWVKYDAWVEAVESSPAPNQVLVDLNDHICTEERCEGVVGDMIVYYDSSHLTTTYARTLAPALAPEFRRLVDSGQQQ